MPTARSSGLPAALLLLALPALVPAAAGAQLVRGIVVDSASGDAVPGVTVRLVDARGEGVAGTLLGANGRFDLHAPAPGRYTLRVQRVGYALTTVGPLDLAATDSIWRRVVVAPVAVSLASIQVTGRRSCEVRPDAMETLLVWEEARKALDATMVTRGTRRIRAGVVDYLRELDPRSLKVREEKREERVGLVDQPYVSRPPESFSRLGYLQEVDGSLWLFAPDADVLLSPSFLDDHCLRLVPGTGRREGMIGLGFEPTDARRLPDIAGVLWLDVASAELRDLEYRYTNLPERMQGTTVGGKVEFARLPNGAWLMRRWTVRAPMLRRDVQPRLAGTGPGGLSAGHDMARQERFSVTGIREAVGEVLWATTTTGAPLLGTPPRS